MATEAATRFSPIADALARDRLGVGSVVFFVLSGIAPLTVAAGVVPTAYGVTGVTAIPAAFIAVAVVLGIFSAGYVAMARHVRNTGAFYAFVARGLGKPLGVGAALMALLAYGMLQVGLFGAFGPGAVSEFNSHLHVSFPWWAWSYFAWLVVSILGMLRVELTGRVLAVLLSIEILVIVGLTVSGLAHPASGYSVATLNPAKLAAPGVGAAIAVAVLGFVGFEGAAVLTEEARNPKRTIAVATYLSLGLIAVVYAGASWALAVQYGNDQVVSVAQQQGPGMLFGLGNKFLSNAGQVFYLTSLFAAMIAFHSFVVRYMFALGREGVLPRALERTSAKGAPKVASGIQSAVVFVVIGLTILFHWDPMTVLFFRVGTTGAFGILLLVTLTAVAILSYFARNRSFESVWQRAIAPGVAAVLLLVMTWLVIHNYATLLGVQPGDPAATWLPLSYFFVAAVGVLWGIFLRLGRPSTYNGIGLGTEAVIRRNHPLATPSPHWSGVEL